MLDEIGEIEPHVQVKLLRVLENGEIQRVGGKGTRRVDVRVIAATNKELLHEVQSGRFREDLYYRLHVVRLKVPSLADRKEDIPLLVDHFLRVYADQNERDIPNVSRTAMADLMAYNWPGNVRELEHLIERTLILNPHDHIERFEMPEPPTSKSAPRNMDINSMQYSRNAATSSTEYTSRSKKQENCEVLRATMVP